MRELEERSAYQNQALSQGVYDELFGPYNDLFSAENFSRFVRSHSWTSSYEEHLSKIPLEGTDFDGEMPDPHDIITGRRALGQELLDRLTDWEWLLRNKVRLQSGLEAAYGHMTTSAFDALITELQEASDGKLYMERGNGLIGRLNPLNPPGDHVRRIYLRKGGILPDEKIMDSRRLSFGPAYSSSEQMQPKLSATA